MAYFGPGVDPSLYLTGAGGGSPLTFTGPGVDPSLYPGSFSTGAPGAPGVQSSVWDKLMAGIGQGALPKMPGTTIGAPAGASGAAAPQVPPMIPPPGQMAPPRGIPNLQALLAPNAPAPGGGLMAQYQALQQLMRG